MDDKGTAKERADDPAGAESACDKDALERIGSEGRERWNDGAARDQCYEWTSSDVLVY